MLNINSIKLIQDCINFIKNVFILWREQLLRYVLNLIYTLNNSPENKKPHRLSKQIYTFDSLIDKWRHSLEL